MEPNTSASRQLEEKNRQAVPAERIANAILVVRGHRVMVDADLARLYGVPTKILLQAVRRNAERFPADFIFQFTNQELRDLRSQIVTSSWGGRRRAPHVFTEQGVAMLSSVLRSPRAIAVNIEIMRAFVRLRGMLIANTALAQKLDELETRIDRRLADQDHVIAEILQAIRALMSTPALGPGLSERPGSSPWVALTGPGRASDHAGRAPRHAKKWVAHQRRRSVVLLRRVLSASTIALLAFIVAGLANAKDAGRTSLRGSVESGGTGLAGYEVSLYARFVGPPGVARVLGRATTGPAGEFRIDYRLPRGLPASQQPLLFVRAKSGPAMLASAIGQAPAAGPVVVNERTTVATGFAFAQFVDGSAIDGNRYGMLNAVRMAANMVRPRTGAVAAVLRLPPNGPETTALPTFNSLANIVAYCIATHVGCQDLFAATTVPGAPRPTNVLQAVANIAKYPWLNVATLFDLSLERPLYAPALAQKPDAWTLFLKFTGSFSSVQDENNLLNGPGAFAIDEEGFLWVNDNYIPEPPDKLACAGTRLLKFYPWGENFPGSPYFGGGLSGAGFGIALAPNGLVWVGNFGFAGAGCKLPLANSVSVFRPNGQPLSRAAGFTAGPISWPQSTVSDRGGNIWIANCAADSVTLYPQGRPGKAFEIPIPPPANAGAAKMKTFGIAIDRQGNAWATGSLNSTLAVIGPAGNVIEVIPPQGPHGRTQLSRPMGIASDSRGNIWVANSDFMDVPCPPDKPELGPASAPSVALFRHDPGRKPHARSPFTGGGITIPWGVAIDGNDTVWVANFGFPFDLANPETTPEWTAPNRVSHFCGVDTSKCPPTKRGVGKAISPDGTGYTSDALDRNTGIAVDPSGNVWLANNWKPTPLVNNPGGNSIAVLVGVAAPLKTPLIGAPRSFDRHDD